MFSRSSRPWLLVLDIAIPVALFYGLRAAGVSNVTALLISTVPAVVSSVASLVRQRRADLVGTAVVFSLVGSAVVPWLGGDARVLLVRGAWISLPFAGVTLWSLRHPQPLCYTFTRAIMPRRAAIMDRLWDEDPRFRLAWRRITVLWGIFSIVDAVIRVVLTYTLPLSVVPALEPIITVATIVALQIPTHMLLRRSGTIHLVFGPRRFVDQAERA